MPEKRVRLRKQWKPEYSIADLPPAIRTAFQREARILLQDLKSYRASSFCKPAAKETHHSHQTRHSDGENPYWYSHLYRAHLTDRHRSNVKRVLIKAALEAIAEADDRAYSPKGGRKTQGRNQRDLRELIYTRLIHGYNDNDGFPYDPNNSVRSHFGLETERLTNYDPDEEPPF